MPNTAAATRISTRVNADWLGFLREITFGDSAPGDDRDEGACLRFGGSAAGPGHGGYDLDGAGRAEGRSGPAQAGGGTASAGPRAGEGLAAGQVEPGDGHGLGNSE